MFSFGEFLGIVHCNCGYTGGCFLNSYMKNFLLCSFEKLNLVHQLLLFFQVIVSDLL